MIAKPSCEGGANAAMVLGHSGTIAVLVAEGDGPSSSPARVAGNGPWRDGRTGVGMLTFFGWFSRVASAGPRNVLGRTG